MTKIPDWIFGVLLQLHGFKAASASLPQSFMLHMTTKIKCKGGSIVSIFACGPRDPSSNPAQGKLVLTNFLRRSPYCFCVSLSLSQTIPIFKV